VTWPATPLAAEIALFLDGAWEDVTALTLTRDPLSITRGNTSEGAQVDRSMCRLTANNTTGDLSPRNPTGAYYGLIGRNTPLRVRVTPASDPYVLVTEEDAEATAPDTAGLSITGDLDVRVDLSREDWAEQRALAGKYEATGNQRSWALYANATKTLSFRWSPTGSSSVIEKTSSAITVADGDRLAVRVTLDVNNGAAGNDVKFYTAATLAGPWVQLGSTVTTAGTTSIFDGTGDLEVGAVADLGIDGITGRIYGLEVYAGLTGSDLRGALDLDLATVDPAGTELTDSIPNTWTLSTAATVVDPACRFLGEVSEWPQRWDTSGHDVYVPLEASGILRRLTQGSSPLASTLYRGLTRLANPPVAYWPCEDGEDATQIASGVGGAPMILAGAGRPDFASYDGFKSSAPLPTMGQSEWTGLVAPYTATGLIRLWFLLAVPSGGTTNGEGLIHLITTGTAHRWVVLYGTGGTVTLKAYDVDGTEILSSGPHSFGLDGTLVRFEVELAQDGADVDYTVGCIEVGDAASLQVASGTLTTDTIGRCRAVVVNPGGELDDVVVGHISVHDDTALIASLFDELNAYAGERAARRIERLCSEEGVAFRAVGNTPAGGPFDDSAAMGYQLPRALIDLLREAGDADGGILYEPRDLLGLGYRTRESLYSQAAALALDYSAGDLTSLEPVDDDRAIRNDVTVRRIGGASARAVLTDGPLSIAAPPDGVGRYDTEVSLSLADDTTLDDRAGWLLHLGTVDEARYPLIGLSLSRPNYTGANADQGLAAMDLDCGDRLTISDLPAWLPPDDVNALAQGFAEELGNFTWRIEVNCVPGRPWSQAAVYDDIDRYTSDGTTLAEDLDTTETSIDISTPTGPVWGDDDAPFDIAIGGERITIAGVSGTGASQTFTGCTRSVNGVVKTHTSGATVELWQPAVYVP
jgi:hypothetical protein